MTYNARPFSLVTRKFMPQNMVKNVELVDVSHVVPDPKNANIHTSKQIQRLKKLIEYQGLRNPLIISNRTGQTYKELGDV